MINRDNSGLQVDEDVRYPRGKIRHQVGEALLEAISAYQQNKELPKEQLNKTIGGLLLKAELPGERINEIHNAFGVAYANLPVHIHQILQEERQVTLEYERRDLADVAEGKKIGHLFGDIDGMKKTIVAASTPVVHEEPNIFEAAASYLKAYGVQGDEPIHYGIASSDMALDMLSKLAPGKIA